MLVSDVCSFLWDLRDRNNCSRQLRAASRERHSQVSDLLVAWYRQKETQQHQVLCSASFNACCTAAAGVQS